MFPRFGCESAAVSASDGGCRILADRSLDTARFGPLPLINRTGDALRDADHGNSMANAYSHDAMCRLS